MMDINSCIKCISSLIPTHRRYKQHWGSKETVQKLDSHEVTNSIL